MKRLTLVLAVAAVMFATAAFSQQSAPKPQTLFTNVKVFDGVHDKLIMHDLTDFLYQRDRDYADAVISMPLVQKSCHVTLTQGLAWGRQKRGEVSVSFVRGMY